ncbi:MAG: SH3 domain-containing protein [Candidatus Latescibacterota bacterium]
MRTAAIALVLSFFTAMLSPALFAQEPKVIAALDVVPPATAAMQNADYWIQRIGPAAEKVIMTPEQIRALNRKNHTRPLETKDINGKPYTFPNIKGPNYYNLQFYPQDPLALKSFPGDSLRIGLGLARANILKGKFWDRRRLPYTDALRQELVSLMGEDRVPATVRPRYGITVAHTLNRAAPYAMPAFWSQYAWQDLFNIGMIDHCSPVAVLHASTDGAWYYVRSMYAYGWIPAVNVAFGSPEQIRRLTESKEFIVALPHAVPVFADRGFQTLATEIYQGARLPLLAKTAAGYRALVPHRKADGSLEAAGGWLKPDADVSTGYQPYTQANVLRTMFRVLNRPYGWGDSVHERDCCGVIRTVLRTFGIITPRGTTHELHCSDHVYAFEKNTPKDVKYKYLDSCDPAITMCGFSGHIVMYLGKVDGSHFVIHSNGYSYHDKDGTEIRIGRVGICDTEIEGGSYIGDWTELTTFKP